MVAAAARWRCWVTTFVVGSTCVSVFAVKTPEVPVGAGPVPKELDMRKKRHQPGRLDMFGGHEAFSAQMSRLLQETSECDLCGGRQDWVFILGTGRSGSTTALEMLNAIPNVYIGGENSGVMNMLMELKAAPTDRRPTSENHVLCALQHFMEVLIGSFDLETTEVVGFKEIRIIRDDQLAFLTRIFPCGRYIVNTRTNLHKQRQSEFRADTPMELLQNWTTTLNTWQEANPGIAFDLKLEDYSVEKFNTLLQFLNFDDCRFTSVAHANWGWMWNDETNTSKEAVRGTCKHRHWSRPMGMPNSKNLSLTLDDAMSVLDASLYH